MVEKMREPINVFVYGTLKRGFGNHHLMDDSIKLCDAVVQGYTLFEEGIPFMVPLEGYEVKGEIYQITKKELERLDALEGHPYWYKRTRMIATGYLGQKIEVWAYVYPEPIGRHNESGEYR